MVQGDLVVVREVLGIRRSRGISDLFFVCRTPAHDQGLLAAGRWEAVSVVHIENGVACDPGAEARVERRRALYEALFALDIDQTRSGRGLNPGEAVLKGAVVEVSSGGGIEVIVPDDLNH